MQSLSVDREDNSELSSETVQHLEAGEVKKAVRESKKEQTGGKVAKC